ncbi:TPA: PDZ domain-containing protein [Candidatus Bathyarchaeota archaeon]|nr:PDZ domain-containing protein [Candidatus Bathyarchaeota archaeon]
MSQLTQPTEILKSISDATTLLVRNLSKSIVSVSSQMSRGTGMILDNNGYVATCNHVLQGCSSIAIGQGGKTYKGKIVGTDPYNDIALLKTDSNEDFKPIEFADSTNLNTGQFVLALANPFNRTHPTATTGIITNPDASLHQWRGTAMENVVATDAKLNPGFSGGPLVDVFGKVIGMNTAYVWSRGIAIPSNKLKATANRLIRGGTIKRAYLGIVSNTVLIPKDLAEDLNIDQQTGVMIFSVERNSPAKKAGLAMGDVVVGFNSKKVTNFYDLPELLTDEVIEKKTEIQILRGNQLATLAIVPVQAREEE